MTRRLSLVLLAALLYGCVPVPPRPSTATPARPANGSTLSGSARVLAATVLQNTLQCGSDLSQPTAQWISNAQQLRQRYRQFAEQASSTALPKVDFTREGVLLIGMGQHPTGGYLLNYQQQPIRYEGETLEVEVSWQEPLPGYKQAQVITSPCLLLRLPKVAVKRVRVLDQDRQVRLDTAV